MSTLLLEPPRERDQLLESDGDRLFAVACYSDRTDGCGRPTLDDLITGVWEGLSAHRTVNCPACGGTMKLRSAAPVWAAYGACLDCGASLS
jgi:hypothetical protein